MSDDLHKYPGNFKMHTTEQKKYEDRYVEEAVKQLNKTVMDHLVEATMNGFRAGRKEASRWIPLSELHPSAADADQYGDVLFANSDHVAQEKWDFHLRPLGINYTHWMPLPEPPK
jgi:hypothetical protein